MAIASLKYNYRLECSSNYVIWKAKMSFLLGEYGMKAYIDNVVVVPEDVDQLKEFRKEMVKANQLILDGVWDHIIS